LTFFSDRDDSFYGIERDVREISRLADDSDLDEQDFDVSFI
jgi:hypothetical protein